VCPGSGAAPDCPPCA